MISSTLQSFLFLIFDEIFLVLFIERRSSTLAVVRPTTGNLISRRQGMNEKKVGTANIEYRKAFTLSKNCLATPLKGKRTEAARIGEASNNAPVGLELISIVRVARLWRRLGWNAGNVIGRRQWANYERFTPWFSSGRTRPLSTVTIRERFVN